MSEVTSQSTKAPRDQRTSEASPPRPPFARWTGVLALSALATTSALCATAFRVYPPAANSGQLAAVGEVFSALFSSWAFIGLIFNQAYQHRAVSLQWHSLDIQRRALEADMRAAEATALALSMEVLSTSTERTYSTLERYAESLVRSCPSILPEAIERAVTALGEDTSSVYTRALTEDEHLLSAVLGCAESGLTSSLASSYVSLYLTMQKRSRLLSKGDPALDLFQLQFENTAASQLYAILSRI